MKKRILKNIIVLLVLICSSVWADNSIIYLSPRPGAKWVSVQSAILIRFLENEKIGLDPSQIKIELVGEKSGFQEGKFSLSKDRSTYFFKPDQPFHTNESVDVTINVDHFGSTKEVSYRFSTSPIAYQDKDVLRELEHNPIPSKNINLNTDKTTAVINGVAVPSDFPGISVNIQGETAPGKLFLASEGAAPYLLILENDGTPYFYQRLSDYSRDFKVQPTGVLTRRERGELFGYVVMDSTFEIIDTLLCGNGYGTDQHGAQILPNGNFLLIGVELIDVDMSQLVEGGSPDARVIGNNVVEHDSDGNVIFEWRSWDHFNILDAEHINFTDLLIDYVHMNSIAVDYDSNIVISSRHLSEVTKINRTTGEIMWRLGGKHNQFEWVNDLDSISYQHDVRPVPGMENHYTIFDNGNHKSPQYSRAVEFLIDTTTMTATKVWEYRHSPDRYAYAMGNVQRLPNGNTLINWSGNPDPVGTEVTADGEKIYELSFTNGAGNYRTFRFDWSGRSKHPYLLLEKFDDRVSLIFNKFGDPNVSGYVIYAGLEPNPETPIDSTTGTWIDLNDFKYNERYYFRVTALDSAGHQSEFSNEVSTVINFVPPGENMILNGEFEDGELFWDFVVGDQASASGFVEEEMYHIEIDSSGSAESDIYLKQGDLSLQEGRHYILEFDAYALSPRTIEVKVEKASEPFDNYSRIGFAFIQTTIDSFAYPFEMTFPTDPEAQLVFYCGNQDADVFFDNISLKEDLSASIAKEDLSSQKRYQLYQNYPNPFNPITAISYQLSAVSEVELSIYNVLGQKVITLVSEKQNAGHYQVKWDARRFSSGVYYYVLQAGQYQSVKKLIILR